MRRTRNAKIVATLGPASSDPDIVRRLFLGGVDVFRLNFSHGTPEDHSARVAIIRNLEKETGRPIGIMADLQGPKHRVGLFVDGAVTLVAGQKFRFDLDQAPGDDTRVSLPHPEIFAVLAPGSQLLLDDGRLRLTVERCGKDFAETTVVDGGRLSEHKGVNVPGAVLPLTSLTPKDHADLDLALDLGVDWVALSFVQRPEDVTEARAIIGDRAYIIAKLEKPAAVERLEEIIAVSDALMVARGDLGVELPAERVPAIQKRIIRSCRRVGKPVVVATQMLESMVVSPVPTRAEASDVATAIYDGADAVMLSAESAAGKYPVEAVGMMNRIIEQVETDPLYRQLIDASHSPAAPGQVDVAGAVCAAMRDIVALLHASAIVCYSRSGHTSLGAARERPESPILSLSPILPTARRLALAWGIHSIHIADVADVKEMTAVARDVARRERFAESGQTIVAIAGVPFGIPGTTNLIRIATA
ncbi:MAG: pyruvate kinase [Steroidobacterales bacterium]